MLRSSALRSTAARGLKTLVKTTLGPQKTSSSKRHRLVDRHVVLDVDVAADADLIADVHALPQCTVGADAGSCAHMREVGHPRTRPELGA